MPEAAPHFLATCHASILQRIIDLADASDLFLLRQVARRWRFAADGRIRRMRPPDDRSPRVAGLLERFPGLTSLNLGLCIFTPRLRLPEMLSTPSTRLRELSLPRFDTALPDKWLAQHLPGLTRLQIIHSENDVDGAAVLRWAAHCSSLRRLQLTDVALLWAPLQAAVSQLAGTLTDLDLRFSRITGEMPHNGLRVFNTGRLQALHLWLESLDLPDVQAAFSNLATFTSLRLLELSCSGMTPAQLEQLNSLRQLTRLELSDVELSSAAVAQLTRLTQLSALRLQQYTEDEIEPFWDAQAALAGFPRLTDLSLSIYTDVVGLECLTRLMGLTRLHTACAVLEAGVVLPRLTGLRSLDILGVDDECRQLHQLSGLTHLTSLHLQLSPPTKDSFDRRLDWLPPLQALQDFALIMRWLDASMLPPLAALTALRYLRLHSALLRPAGCDLRPLEQLPALQWLSLPQAFEQPEQLPARLRVPFMKGRRASNRWAPLLE